MAPAKRYYWLKLKEDFFDEDTINWLEEQPNGKEYALFYLKLCLKSLKSNGYLIRTVGDMFVPYDTKKIAEITKTDFDTTIVAMELLKKIGLIQILDSGEIYLTKLSEMVGSETTKAITMRKIREKNKLENSKNDDDGNIVTKMFPECSQTVAPEYRDKSIEIDKELELKKKKTNSPVSALDFSQTNFSEQLKAAITDWLQYKTERKEPYKSTGLKKLITRIQKSVDNYGENAVIDIIEASMSANYQGIIWDKLNQYKPVQKNQNGQYNANKIYEDFD